MQRNHHLQSNLKDGQSMVSDYIAVNVQRKKTQVILTVLEITVEEKHHESCDTELLIVKCAVSIRRCKVPLRDLVM